MTDLLMYEREYWSRYIHIAGIDEVGRGCLFGDVVAAAVILPEGLVIEGINDSKKLSAKKRETLYDLIMEQALAVGVGLVDAETIDRINIKQAARLAMKMAIEQLAVTPQFCLLMLRRWNAIFPSVPSSKVMLTVSPLPRHPLLPR